MSQDEDTEINSFLGLDDLQFELLEQTLQQCLKILKTIEVGTYDGTDTRTEEVDIWHKIKIVESHLKPRVPLTFDNNTRVYLQQTQELLKDTIEKGGMMTQETKDYWEVITDAWKNWVKNLENQTEEKKLQAQPPAKK